MSGSVLKVPAILREQVFALSAEGKPSQSIAEWLLAEHGITITDSSIRRMLRQHRDELADAAKGVARDELRKYLAPGVKAIAGVMERAEKIEKSATDNGKPDVALRAHDRMLRAATMLLHFAGLSEPDVNQEHVDGRMAQLTRTDLLKRLERLVAAETDPAPEPPVH